MAHRCLDPGSGQCVRSGEDGCGDHAGLSDPPAPEVLAQEIDALRYVLQRMMKEINDVDVLATFVTRITSVAIQAARARHQISGEAPPDLLTMLEPTLSTLARDIGSRERA